MNPLQTALSKFTPPFNSTADYVHDINGDELIIVDAFTFEDDKIIGQAIADFLNTAVQKTDAEI